MQDLRFPIPHDFHADDPPIVDHQVGRPNVHEASDSSRIKRSEQLRDQGVAKDEPGASSVTLKPVPQVSGQQRQTMGAGTRRPPRL